MDWIAARAEQFPRRVALAGEGEGPELSYAELDAAVQAEAERLASEGIRAGDEVTVTEPASVDLAVRIHALGRLGAVAFPLDPRLGGAERDAARAATAPPPAPIRHRILTGGSSGAPKAIGLTAANHRWSAVGSALNLGVEPGDRWLCCLPFFHVSGLTILMRSAIYGTAAEIHDGFDTDRAAAALDSGRVSIVSLVATQLSRLLEAGADISSPRVLLVGGGPLPEDLLEEALGRGATVAQTYGMTETCSQVATLSPPDARRKLGSAGKPLLSANIRVAGDGEIQVRGPTVAPGAVAEDGWLHTGDLGRFDEEGFLWVTGRKSETIVTGGENVMPREVEAVLLRHPGVADAAVIGMPDPEWQEAVTALVVPAPGSSPGAADLRAHCAASLAPHKIPKAFELVGSLPRTEAGKLRRSELIESRRRGNG